jgi:lambda repressor-like predicted transcriptional regulator
MVKKGVNHSVLASAVGVTDKTVGNWLKGSTPYPKFQSATAAVLGVDPVELWPESDPGVRSAAGEIIAAWPRRSDCPPEYWWRLIEASERRIDILGYAVLFLTENHADLVDVLADRADSGCNVRIILADPDAPATKARDDEEALGGALLARIRASLKYLSPLFDTAASIQFQTAPMYSSVFRFDDDLMVTPHLFATPGKHAPLFHLRRLGTGGIFDQLAGHFEAVWTTTTAAQDSR